MICGLLAVALQLILANTRFGSRLRAAVDDPRVARGLGINVPQVFALTFAFGSGLAGLGGALGAEILGLDPYFPLKFMIYFLIVVTVGGTSSITGPFLASLLLGVADVAGKYYVPELGAFVIYIVMIVILICVRTACSAARLRVEPAMTQSPTSHPTPSPAPAGAWPRSCSGCSRLRCAFLFPARYLILNEIVRLALFALSLDLILGYAGIVSLGHAAFFGVGAYSAGLLALHGIINEPVIALVAAV